MAGEKIKNLNVFSYYSIEFLLYCIVLYLLYYIIMCVFLITLFAIVVFLACKSIIISFVFWTLERIIFISDSTLWNIDINLSYIFSKLKVLWEIRNLIELNKCLSIVFIKKNRNLPNWKNVLVPSCEVPQVQSAYRINYEAITKK